MILSVVIPSYNVEKFLDKTLSSFVFDKMSDRVEIIVVDDGSKDKTAEIAHSYERRYPGIFKTISKENGGHGSTINKGIEVAAGKYFKVVDGDDWVDTQGFEKLVDLLETCDSDLIITNYCEVDDNTGAVTPIIYDSFQNGETVCFTDMARRLTHSMHASTVKTAVLRDHSIRLDEHCFYVDVEYVLFMVPYLQTVTFGGFSVYMYRVAQQAQSVSILGFQKHIEDHIRVSMRLAAFAREYELSKEADPIKVHYITERMAQMILSQAMIFESYPHKDKAIRNRFKEYDLTLKGTNEKIYSRSSELSPTLRILRKFNFRCYRALLWMSGKVHRQS